MKIYLLLGHPLVSSGFIADMTEQKLLANGHEVRRQNIGEMDFDPVLWKAYKDIQDQEPSLQEAWDNIRWCNKWIIIYPVWWGAAPALLKGFFDRVLLPGKAFKYHDEGPLWDKLLKKRSAHIITTSDAPKWWLWWEYGDSDIRSLKNATLKFCGFRPVKVTRICKVKYMTTSERQKNIKCVIEKVSSFAKV